MIELQSFLWIFNQNIKNIFNQSFFSAFIQNPQLPVGNFFFSHTFHCSTHKTETLAKNGSYFQLERFQLHLSFLLYLKFSFRSQRIISSVILEKVLFMSFRVNKYFKQKQNVRNIGCLLLLMMMLMIRSV